MSLTERLVARALGRAPTVQVVVTPRFADPPTHISSNLLEELWGDGDVLGDDLRPGRFDTEGRLEERDKQHVDPTISREFREEPGTASAPGAVSPTRNPDRTLPPTTVPGRDPFVPEPGTVPQESWERHADISAGGALPQPREVPQPTRSDRAPPPEMVPERDLPGTVSAFIPEPVAVPQESWERPADISAPGALPRHENADRAFSAAVVPAPRVVHPGRPDQAPPPATAPGRDFLAGESWAAPQEFPGEPGTVSAFIPEPGPVPQESWERPADISAPGALPRHENADRAFSAAVVPAPRVVHPGRPDQAPPPAFSAATEAAPRNVLHPGRPDRTPAPMTGPGRGFPVHESGAGPQEFQGRPGDISVSAVSGHSAPASPPAFSVPRDVPPTGRPPPPTAGRGKDLPVGDRSASVSSSASRAGPRPGSADEAPPATVPGKGLVAHQSWAMPRMKVSSSRRVEFRKAFSVPHVSAATMPGAEDTARKTETLGSRQSQEGVQKGRKALAPLATRRAASSHGSATSVPAQGPTSVFRDAASHMDGPAGPAEGGARRAGASEPPAPPVQVRIGRIDVRMPPAPAPAQPRGPTVSLDSFLRRGSR